MRHILDNEIDLFELFQILWLNKLLFSIFVFFALLFGCTHIYFKDNVYESKLFYSLDTLPPLSPEDALFYKMTKVYTDFESMFYSKIIFDNWNKDNKNSLLTFKDFSKTKIKNDFVFSKDDSELLIKFVKKLNTEDVVVENESSYLIIKHNQKSILNDIFNYSNYIADTLKSKYELDANKALSMYKKNSLSFFSAKQYLYNLSKGGKVFSIQRPTYPIKISPKPYLTLTIYGLLGIIIGILFIFIREYIFNRKKLLPEM